MKEMKRENGITLIVLVITIVVLLILSVAIISTVFDDKIIGLSNKFAYEFENKHKQEQNNLNEVNDKILKDDEDTPENDEPTENGGTTGDNDSTECTHSKTEYLYVEENNYKHKKIEYCASGCGMGISVTYEPHTFLSGICKYCNCIEENENITGGNTISGGSCSHKNTELYYEWNWESIDGQVSNWSHIQFKRCSDCGVDLKQGENGLSGKYENCTFNANNQCIECGRWK